MSGEKESRVRVNQVGWRPHDRKIIVFADVPEGTFRIITARENSQDPRREDAAWEEFVPEEAISSEAVWNPASGEWNVTADLSGLTTEGRYRIVLSTGEVSHEFRVNEHVYDGLLRSALRMLTLQRCGVSISEKMAGRFAHPACHTEPALILGSKETKDVSGGWHDAGDYGKYIVPGAKTVADLLIAYEADPGAEELAKEAAFELDWMLKMQTDEGGVWHKVAGKSFPGFVMPQEETEEWVLSPVSVTATADFAAVMAMAARTLRECDAQCDKYRSAAERAYRWLEAHREEPGFHNPDGVVTGEYPDEETADERFFAAAALYRLTKEERYLTDAKCLFEKLVPGPGAISSDMEHGLGWTNVSMYGIFELMQTDQLAEADPAFCERLREELRAAAEHIAVPAGVDPYGIDKATDYEWGSNLSVANAGIVLMMAQRLLGGNYRELAQRQLDYLLGVNPMDLCYVTGAGTRSPQHPHHRPSEASGSAVPGMLVGGPDSRLEDPYAQETLKGMPPARCYVDDVKSYSTNEVTIYWNSALICLLKLLMVK